MNLFKDTKDVKDMRPMELYRYLRENTKICNSCSQELKYLQFYYNDELNCNCKKCAKKEKDAELTKQIFGVALKNIEEAKLY